MKVLRSPHELQSTLRSYRPNTVIGLVLTMGNLHDGHLELVRRAKTECDVVVTTLFVNPLQFSANEDFDSYPNSFDLDQALLENLKTEILFCPTARTMYPKDQAQQTLTIVPNLGNTLCGVNRPGHFDGVTTVVVKLFNLVQPNKAYFGEKDWQQLTIIRKMVLDLNYPIDTIGVPTVRAPDDLALSSRNEYLSEDQRRLAPQLYRLLCWVRDALLNGDTDIVSLENKAMNELTALGFGPNYVAVRDAESLGPVTENSTNRRVFGAAFLDRARLIDNIPIDSL